MPGDGDFKKADIDTIVNRVLEKLGAQGRGVEGGDDLSDGAGIFPTVDRAVDAAERAFRDFREIPLSVRNRIVEGARKAAIDATPALSEHAVAETGMGRVEDKIKKNLLVATKTPGTEVLVAGATTGDHGLTLTDHAPFGVIGSIVPSTNPTETVINNGISMIAAGNTVVFNAHPGARNCTNRCVTILNNAMHQAGGPPALFTAVAEPDIKSAQAIMKHPSIRLLVVTGGAGVVSAAMASGKRVVAAGPGNPPSVVDETADLDQAGRDIVAGGSLDNNVICVDEKEVICVDSVADALKESMRSHGAYELAGEDIDRLRKLVLSDDRGPGRQSVPNRDFIGKDAGYILDALGIRTAHDHRLIVADVPNDHPFIWSELMMPVMGLTRVGNVDDAIDLARRAEHGFRHTASMHSRNIDKLSKMARVMDCSIFIKNGPHYAGLGFGGEGSTSFTIASPTGDGLTNALTFTRPRRCVLVDRFRIV